MDIIVTPPLMSQAPLSTHILLGQDAETLRLLISTAIAAQNKREQAPGQGNIPYRPDPKKIEEEEGEKVKSQTTDLIT